MATNYVNCRNCSAQNSMYDGVCRNCGTALPNVGMPMQPAGSFQMQNQMQKLPGADKKLAAGLCGILLGGFGVHKFILGYTNEGVIMLVISVLGFAFVRHSVSRNRHYRHRRRHNVFDQIRRRIRTDLYH